MKFYKKRGFTDKLYFANLIFTWLFTVVCIILTIFSGMLYISDLSIVSVGMSVVWAELGVHTGFVIRKAWIENLSKHKTELQEIKQIQETLSNYNDIGGVG